MTAKEFLELSGRIYDPSIARMMVNYAQYMVGEAVEAIHNTAFVEFLDEDGEAFDYSDVIADECIGVQVNPDSILNAFDVSEIKIK